jgi:hypothetical protein
MPKAGFWAIGGYAISFRKDGRWYADEEPIENPHIARLFSEHVRPDGAGGWVIDVGIDRQPVTIEDTALVVTSVEGDCARGFRVRGNDGVAAELDCSTLVIGPDNVLYCDLDRGERGILRARFLRAPYYVLSELMRIDDRTGEATLECRGRRHVLRRLPAR